jgi:hypothetical protein
VHLLFGTWQRGVFAVRLYFGAQQSSKDICEATHNYIYLLYSKIVPLHTQHVVLHVKIWHLSLFAILNQLIAFKVISESSQF